MLLANREGRNTARLIGKHKISVRLYVKRSQQVVSVLKDIPFSVLCMSGVA